jgi:hypothetical protein
MNFATYGPYELKEWSRNGIHALFDEAVEEQDGLNKAIGIYIISTRNRKGKLIPAYVGKTVNSFGKRFLEHYGSNKFHHLFSEKSSVHVFLIPRITGKGKFVKSTAKLKKSGLPSIDRLEFALIGSCLAQNSELINVRDATLHKTFHVPGYWNSKPKDFDNAARELATMLGTKQGV